MRKGLALLGLILMSGHAVAAQGVITTDSAYSAEDTAERLVQAIEARGLTVAGRIDHAQTAAREGRKLPPAQLILFSYPSVDAELMHCRPTIGLELPHKALVWEDTVGRVRLSYLDPAQTADRHDIGDCGESLTRLESALKDIAFAATTEESSILDAQKR